MMQTINKHIKYIVSIIRENKSLPSFICQVKPVNREQHLRKRVCFMMESTVSIKIKVSTGVLLVYIF